MNQPRAPAVNPNMAASLLGLRRGDTWLTTPAFHLLRHLVSFISYSVLFYYPSVSYNKPLQQNNFWRGEETELFHLYQNVIQHCFNFLLFWPFLAWIYSSRASFKGSLHIPLLNVLIYVFKPPKEQVYDVFQTAVFILPLLRSVSTSSPNNRFFSSSLYSVRSSRWARPREFLFI